MTPNIREILLTTARNRRGYLFARFGPDFPIERYEYHVENIICDSPTFAAWLDDVRDAMIRIEDGYAIYKVFNK